MTSDRFNGANETGPVAEIFMPDKYVKDPASDDFMRIYNQPNSTNRITMFGPTEIPQTSTRALQQILSRRDGELRPNTREYDTVVAMMGGGYHTIQDNPHVSIETINGRKCIVLSNENAQRDVRAWTMFVPTDGMRYLYPVTFEGSRSEFNAVRNGFNQTKWRRTPDAVTPPQPRPNR